MNTDYDNHGCFIWNPNNNNIVNSNDIYEDAFIHTGTVVKGQWENSVGVVYQNDTPKIISNTNHFIHGNKWGPAYNNLYKIYDNIVRNYYEIINSNNINLSLYNDEKYFFMINAFCFSNSGHDLSCMLDFYSYILNNNIKNIVILKGYKETNNFKLLSTIIKDDIIIHELDLNTVYKFKNIVVIKPNIMNILYHKNLIDDMRNKIIELYSEKYEEYKGMNIILMKTNRNKNVMLEYTRINCEKMLTLLENNGFVNIIPEEIDPFKLAIMLLFANKIIFSVGSILYTNKLMFGENSKLYFITKNNNRACSDDSIDKRSQIFNFNIENFDNTEQYIEVVNSILE